MSKTFDSIKQELGDALACSKEIKRKAVVHKFSPIDVKNIRIKIGKAVLKALSN